MIKKFLLTILLLIILAVLGVISLVVLVDPNNFKGFISEQVKDKTGYELTIEGDLRWHIWPQISILTDSVRLEDEGAKKPLLTADNMRLDVELLPLFSKQLNVKNVLVKSAVINVTDDSKGSVAHGAKPTTTVNDNKTEKNDNKQNKNSDSKWSFTLNKLDIADSTVVYQQNKDIINFRDTNISVEQKDDKNIVIDLNGTVNRNQQDFNYSLNADVNLAHFPESAEVVLHKLNYTYKGIGVPAKQLSGDVSATFNFQKSPFTLNSKNLVFTLNGNKFKGKLNANLDKKPSLDAQFTADKFDLTPFLSSNSDETKNKTKSKSSANESSVSAKKTKGNELAFLNSFDGKFSLNINEVIANNISIGHFVLDVNNKDGVTKVNKLDFDIANGHVSASGIANGKQAKTAINLITKITDIDLATLLTQLKLTNNFKGQFFADGGITIDTIESDKIMNSLKGNLAVNVKNARLENLNLQQIVQGAVTQYLKKPITVEDYQKYTDFSEISANANLQDGNMNLLAVRALSLTLDVNGMGRIGLAKQDLDVDLQIKILNGWNGENKTIQTLQKVVIPVRIYGSFDQIHYRVDAEKLLNDVLNGKLQDELNRFKDRLNGTKTEAQSEDSSSSIDKVDTKKDRKSVLGGLIKKYKDKHKDD